MRRFFCLLLLICLPLQSFALQGGQLLSAGIAHELQHDQGVQHHHDEDGSVHYDQSDESEQHAAEHSASSHSVWAPAALPPPMPEAAARLLARGEPARSIPAPFLDGPHRPPAPALG